MGGEQRKIWDSVKAAHPDQKLWEIGRIIGHLWRELPANEKQKFMDEYEAEKKIDSRIMLPPCDITEDVAIVFSRICSEQQLISDEPEHFTDRQLAAARYQRNQRMLLEIFSDVCIPDQRGIMTTTRLQNLQRQVESLTMHKVCILW
ncbi:unnamed protein product [Soboliphyme baturini]|uniref:HMG box domain-containing protein n=1 Tax=Soboliphyme baturini TaxID=241478 RepID=A0A183J4U8_9BILA|nr:unnamed protein product [Soboliphyme baturini]